MTTPLRVLALSGSLRAASYNTAALRAAAELAPDGMTVELADLGGLPLFNEDVERAGWPAAALDLARRAAAADALLVASPEYNHSFSGALKNALDWLSRSPPGFPPKTEVLAGKAVALLGASSGRSGTGRSQLHLRQVFAYLDLHAVNRPEVLIDHAAQKFDAAGRLIDEPTRAVLTSLLDALAAWCRRIGTAGH